MVADALPKVETPVSNRPGTPKRWTVEQYLAMVEAGILGPEDRVEFLEGEIVNKMGQNPPHIVGLMLLVDALRIVFGTNFRVDSQIPIVVQGNIPEPDVVVLRGTARDYVGRYPTASDARLVAEVSDSSTAYDRGTKLKIYAQAMIEEYWILNVADRQLEIHRHPLPSGVYGEARVLGETDAVTLEDREIRVADLLP